MPKVSIIVPVYNVEKYLDRCMQTLLNQTLEDIEIILVDDGSPDNCPKLCDEYAWQDPRVKVIHKKNGGLGYARNSGLDVATGEYVAFVDSDDYTSVEAYETLFKVAKGTDADIAYAGFNYQNADGTVDKCFMLDRCFAGKKEMTGFLSSMIYDSKPKEQTIWMSVWNGLYRRRLLEENNIRFESEREYLSEDILFHAQFIPLCDKIVCIPQTFYHYCYNGKSLTRKFNTRKIGSNFRLYEALTAAARKYNLPELHWKISMFLIGYTRGIILRGIITSDMSFKDKRKLCEDVYSYDGWNDVSRSLIGKRLPLFDRAGLLIIHHKAFLVNYIIYVLYYSILGKGK